MIYNSLWMSAKSLVQLTMKIKLIVIQPFTQVNILNLIYSFFAWKFVSTNFLHFSDHIAWRTSRTYINEQIRRLRSQLHELKEIRSHLKTKRPGQYQEVHPGQYFEVNPGQFSEKSLGRNLEIHPGQYSEDLNPGLYKEIHPGQYSQDNFEVNPGQFSEINLGRDLEIHAGQYLEDVDKEIHPGPYFQDNMGQ